MTMLTGLRVLVIEDEGLVALMIEDMLVELGCEVVGSIAELSRACEAASAADIDLAMLDVNLAGKPVFPVAEILRDRAIPFLFSTGYGASGLPSEFADHEVLHKPYSNSELRQKIELTLKRS
jgi:DNA-binding response OmpR family regulator